MAPIRFSAGMLGTILAKMMRAHCPLVYLAGHAQDDEYRTKAPQYHLSEMILRFQNYSSRRVYDRKSNRILNSGPLVFLSPHFFVVICYT